MKNPTINITGAYGPAKAFAVRKVLANDRLNLIVAADKKSADELTEDLAFFGVGAECYPGIDTFPFETLSPSVQITAERLRLLDKVVSGKIFTLVLPVQALFHKVFDRDYLQQKRFKIAAGEKTGIPELIAKLSDAGYQQVPLVQEIGDMAVRGKVIDFYPADFALPLRVRFDNAGILQINLFEVDDQRTVSEPDNCVEDIRTEVPSATIIPVREFVPQLKITEDYREVMRKRGEECEAPPSETEKIIKQLAAGKHFPGIEVYQSLAGVKKVSLFDLLNNEFTLFLNNPSVIEHAIDQFDESVQSRMCRYLSEHILIPNRESVYLTSEQLRSKLKKNARFLIDAIPLYESTENSDIKVKSRFLTEENVSLRGKAANSENGPGKVNYLEEFIESKIGQGFRIAIVVGSEGRRERLSLLLKNLTHEPWAFQGTPQQWIAQSNPNPFVVLIGTVSRGVELTDERIILIAEQELFPEKSVRKKRRAAKNLKKLMSLLSNLSEGDFLVHADYGIGKYCGLEHREIEGKINDFIVIEYSDSKLYLPVANIGKIQKYLAAEGQTPAIDKLGSTRWLKVKSKLKKSLEIIAAELIQLYAERKVTKGWQYESWGAADESFAEDFAYVETEDQLQAIEDTINNMSQPVPMDRVVCGDVGFGKTEIAIRAAYKAFQHAKQAAVMVPTTLLAEQHLKTFQERFQEHGVKIGCVSRLRSAKTNSATLEKLKAGELDIIIGTHRLLSKDVSFYDLGLLIVDEEHRFGVKQKEKIKKLKKDIDILTLTATPIPRTLHMSLLGIRDISVLTTAPVDRKVIRTHVARYDDGLIRDAIMRELERGGQCFYVRPKIEGIVSVAEELGRLIPEARIAYAHGQMDEVELETVMHKFINHEFDVLISTTIIESGIDIPRANTILIERADMFGLAQLYQLRGRVGRSASQAYCYFMVPRSQKLTLQAEQRLKALQSLDDLGIGFQLAIRDMEIRGVGNLLGKEQSGEILSVGYELYMKILHETILNLKDGAEGSLNTIDPELKFYVDAYIPDEYIPDISERLILYQRLSNLAYEDLETRQRPDSEFNRLILEIEDRFGPMPPEVGDLITIMGLKAVLRHHQILKAEYSEGKLSLQLAPEGKFDIVKIQNKITSEPGRYRFSKGLLLSVDLSGRQQGLAGIAEFIEKLLQAIRHDPALAGHGSLANI